MPSSRRFFGRAVNALRHPIDSGRQLGARLALRLQERRWEMLQRRAGGTLWLQRNGHWLPFHGDGDLQEVQYLHYGVRWFEDESDRLGRWLHPGAVVVDVGANLGFTSLVFARLIGEAGKVYAFEPSPHVYPKLIEVLNKNEVGNVTCFQRGCGADRKTETLLVPASSGNATIRTNREDVLRKVTIEIDTLDRMLLGEVSRVDLLKIDTEGFEDEVLAGASELVARYRPLVYIELSQEYADSSARAIAWLQERGYQFDRPIDLEQVRNGDNFLAFPQHHG